MTFKTFVRPFNFAIFLSLLILVCALSVNSQGISGSEGVHSSSLKSTPGKDRSRKTYKAVTKQNDSTKASKTETIDDTNELVSELRRSIKEANKDCLLAQEKEKAGKLKEAQELYAKSLSIRQRFWGLKDPSQATILYKIAELHEKLGNASGAEDCLKQALVIESKHSGPGSFDSVPILEQLAKITMSEKKFDDAEGYYERVEALEERQSGPDAQKTFVARLNLIDAEIASKNYKAAKQNLDKTEEIYNKLCKTADSKIQDKQKNDYLDLLDRYAAVLKTLNKSEEAQIYASRALELRK